ncbi:MAG: hypothetical protein L0I03_08545, partial [Lactococcus lactis]|nr:hypothetical protein [Lactococcus lactis]
STVNNDVASGSNSYGGGSQNNYSQGGSNTSQNNSNSGSSNQGQGNNGQSNSNSNSNTNTGGNGSNTNNNGSNGGNSGQPTHTTKYLGWVSVDGVRKYTKMCDTVAEAQSYVDSIVNSAEVINLGFDHSIGYGLDTVEV